MSRSAKSLVVVDSSIVACLAILQQIIMNLWGKQPEENKAIIIVNLIYAAEGWDWEQGEEWSVER